MIIRFLTFFCFLVKINTPRFIKNLVQAKKPAPLAVKQRADLFILIQSFSSYLAIRFYFFAGLYRFFEYFVKYAILCLQHEFLGHEIDAGIDHAFYLLNCFFHLCSAVCTVYFALVCLFHNFTFPLPLEHTKILTLLQQLSIYLLLFDVAYALINYGPDMVISQEVDDLLALTSVAYQPGLFEYLELVGYC